jgi:hypothetical protein
MGRSSDAAETGHALKRARKLKKDFDAAHRKGMRALKRRDYKEFGEAIEMERKVISALPRPKMKASMPRRG